MLALNSFVLATLPALVSAWPYLDIRDNGVNYTSVFASGLSPGASIHYPNQPDYNTTTVQRWSTWEEPTFVVTIKPAVASDVQYIIRTANEHNFTFYATGGAHGGEPGFGTVKHAVNIDLSGMNYKNLDVNASRLTIGPGNSFVDFEPDLFAVGKFIPVGNAFCVNMIGATIGAGVGPYQGFHGLIIDALRSVQLVTATGKIVTASETENNDLFWAVRGAGANFGVITEATYEIFDTPNKGYVQQADFTYPGTTNASLWQTIESWDKTYPKEMGMTAVVTYNHTTGLTAISVSTTFFGPYANAKPWFNQFLALKPTKWQNQTIPWSNASQASGYGHGANACVRGVYNNHPSIGTKVTSASTYVEALNDFINIMSTRPWYQGSFVVQRFNTTATLAVPKSKQGVYPGREISGLIVLENYYDGPQHDAEVYKLWPPIREKLAATSGFGGLQTYINYAYGDEGPEVWYGKQNLPRLVALKNTWDPMHKFGPGNPIPKTI